MTIHLRINTQPGISVYSEELQPQCGYQYCDIHLPTHHTHTPAQSRFNPVFAISVNSMRNNQLCKSEI